jgi:hypothetical protein
MKRNPTVLEPCLVYLVSNITKGPLFSEKKKKQTKVPLKRTHCILKEHQNKKTKWSGNVPSNMQQLPGVL